MGFPTFLFKVVEGCRTALKCQVRKAVTIQQRGEALNHRDEVQASVAEELLGLGLVFRRRIGDR